MTEEQKKEKTLEESMKAVESYQGWQRAKSGFWTLCGLTVLCLLFKEAAEGLSCDEFKERQEQMDKERWEAEKPLRDARLQEMMKYSSPRHTP